MNRCGVACLALALALAGCAGQREIGEVRLRAESADARQCAEWYDALDARIAAAGVSDAQDSRVPGFPYLRTDRLLASLAERARSSDAAFHAYVERLLALDLAARQQEIGNLPGPVPRGELLGQARTCARLLSERDFAVPALRTALLENSAVPDDYSDAARLAGLYPLTRLFFSRGVRAWEDETRASFAAAHVGTNVVRYAPPPAQPALSRAEAASLIGRAELDALGIPRLSARELARFAAAYAPSVEIRVTGDYDRPGALRWGEDPTTPEVDTAAPVVYVQQAHTRYGERVLLQIVYTMWFSERPAEREGDLLAGRLDGLVWRVTLAPDGEPLVYDSIHPCGCYHQFFPTARAQPLPAPDPLEEWAFSPLRLPRAVEGARPLVRLAPRTHYLEAVALTRNADSVVQYARHDSDELRSLPRGGGGRRSAFGPDGIVPGTERAERLLFWPMGIRSAGAMRQWGRQATAFVGRRHFDDADLLERRFVLDLGKARP